MFHPKGTFDFINRQSTLDVIINVSVDAQSLFTNVHIYEVIAIITEYAFKIDQKLPFPLFQWSQLHI